MIGFSRMHNFCGDLDTTIYLTYVRWR